MAPVLGFSGYSGAGKTTLLEQVITSLTGPHGLRLAVLKHAHHAFDVDHPGKDSWRHRQAGASQVLVSSDRRWALMTEIADGRDPPRLADLLDQLDPGLDLVLVEGFKREPIARVEVWRPVVDRPPLATSDPDIKAIACPVGTALPALAGQPERLDIDDPDQVVRGVLTWRASRYQ